MTPWSPDEEARLRAMVSDGLPLKLMANLLNRSPSSVAGMMERRDLSIVAARRELWRKEQDRRARPDPIAALEPIALAVQALVEQGRFEEWIYPNHARVDGRLYPVERLPGLVESEAA